MTRNVNMSNQFKCPRLLDNFSLLERVIEFPFCETCIKPEVAVFCALQCGSPHLLPAPRASCR